MEEFRKCFSENGSMRYFETILKWIENISKPCFNLDHITNYTGIYAEELYKTLFDDIK